MSCKELFSAIKSHIWIHLLLCIHLYRCLHSFFLNLFHSLFTDDITVTPGSKKKRRRLPQVAKGSWLPVLGSEISLPPPPDRNHIENVMNESIKQWLRLEFLMDYDCQGDKLFCMMCATILPSLSINDLKIHILDNHPTSIYFNPAQKGIIIESWINHKETPQEIVDVEEEMDEDEEDDADFDLINNDLNEDDDPADKAITEKRLQTKLETENINGETRGKEEQKEIEVLEKDGLKPSKAQQLKKSKLESRNVISLEEEKTREEKHSEQEVKEAKLKNEGIKAKTENMLEDQLKNREEKEKASQTQLLDKEKQKSIEPQLEDKLKSRETKFLDKKQTKDTQQREQEKCVDKEARLNVKKHIAIETPLPSNEDLKAKEVQTHKEKQCNSTEVKLEENANKTQLEEKKVKESNHMTLMNVKEQFLTSIVETAIKNIKKEPEELVEEQKKLLIIPEKRLIQMQPVPQVQPAQALLGIGVPLLKSE